MLCVNPDSEIRVCRDVEMKFWASWFCGVEEEAAFVVPKGTKLRVVNVLNDSWNGCGLVPERSSAGAVSFAKGILDCSPRLAEGPDNALARDRVGKAFGLTCDFSWASEFEDKVVEVLLSRMDPSTRHDCISDGLYALTVDVEDSLFCDGVVEVVDIDVINALRYNEKYGGGSAVYYENGFVSHILKNGKYCHRKSEKVDLNGQVGNSLRLDNELPDGTKIDPLDDVIKIDGYTAAERRKFPIKVIFGYNDYEDNIAPFDLSRYCVMTFKDENEWEEEMDAFCLDWVAGKPLGSNYGLSHTSPGLCELCDTKTVLVKARWIDVDSVKLYDCALDGEFYPAAPVRVRKRDMLEWLHGKFGSLEEVKMTMSVRMGGGVLRPCEYNYRTKDGHIISLYDEW